MIILRINIADSSFNLFMVETYFFNLSIKYWDGQARSSILARPINIPNTCLLIYAIIINYNKHLGIKLDVDDLRDC